VGGLFNGLTAHLTGDWSLDTGTLNLACNTATFDATGNLVADAYDGTGTGLNRWCITDSGDAVAGNILSGKIAWVDGLAITGTMPTQTLSAANDTVFAGYYVATTLSAVDTDLTTGNIKTGITIFGVAGSASPLILPKTGQTIVYQINDDGTYQKGFAGTRFTDNANGTITDNATNLMWIKDHSAVGAPFNAIMTWTDAITNCENLTYATQTDWRLPNVKELQSIADYGRYGPAIDPLFTNTQSFYWSSTTYASNTTYAWFVYFYSGNVNYDVKTSSYYVRCVR
jgi:hypothetical protein